MANSENWLLVEFFTVREAAALWCGLAPPHSDVAERDMPDAFHAIKQALTQAIQTDKLGDFRAIKQALTAVQAGPFRLEATKSLKRLNDCMDLKISRSDLETWAKSKNQSPPFLFERMLHKDVRCDSGSFDTCSRLTSASAADGSQNEIALGELESPVVLATTSLISDPAKKAQSEFDTPSGNMKAWLIEQMRSSPNKSEKPKSHYLKLAKAKFNCSKRAFYRDWDIAKDATGATNWGTPGRKKV